MEPARGDNRPSGVRRRPAAPGEDRSSSPHYHNSISLQLQRTKDEYVDPPGRYRPSRYENPNPTGFFLIDCSSWHQRVAKVAPMAYVEASPHPGRMGSPNYKSFDIDATPKTQGLKRRSSESIRGIYIFCLFGGAPRQYPRTFTAFYGYFHGVPRTTADTPRATVYLPRASTGMPWASTESCGTPWRPIALAMTISTARSTASSTASSRHVPRQSPRQATAQRKDSRARPRKDPGIRPRQSPRKDPRTRPRKHPRTRPRQLPRTRPRKHPRRCLRKDRPPRPRKTHGHVHGHVRGHPRKHPRTRPRNHPRKPTDTPTDTSAETPTDTSADTHGNTLGHVRGSTRRNPRTRRRTRLRKHPRTHPRTRPRTLSDQAIMYTLP